MKNNADKLQNIINNLVILTTGQGSTEPRLTSFEKLVEQLKEIQKDMNDYAPVVRLHKGDLIAEGYDYGAVELLTTQELYDIADNMHEGLMEVFYDSLNEAAKQFNLPKASN